MVEDKFTLLHTMLYAKDWYKRSDNIWEDLKVMLTLDGYSVDLMDKRDIVSVILNQCQSLKTKHFTDLLVFSGGVSKEEVFKTGYEYQGMPFQKEGTIYPEYDFKEAIIWYCISNLRFIGKEKISQLPHPDYVNGLKRRKGISNKTLNQFFNK